MEDQPLYRSIRLQNLPPSDTVDPPLPPQRKRLGTDGSFEPIGVSKVTGELELRSNQVDTTIVKIKDLQADEFARNFNPPLTDLRDPMIVQVIPFDSPIIGVPVRRVMARSGEGISTPTSVVLAGGVPSSLVATPRPNAPTTPLSLSSWVVKPPTYSNVVDPYSGVFFGIPSAPFSSPYFMHTSHSGPVGSSSFF